MDSEDYSTDESGKRKAAKGAEAYFERSKKIQRTPTKHPIKEEDKLDLILSMMRDMKADQKVIKNDLQNMRVEQSEFQKEMKKIKQENERLSKENEEARKENKEIKEELLAIRNNIEWMEKDKRKNNVILKGLFMDTNEPETLKGGVEDFIKVKLKVNVKVKEATKIGEGICLIKLENEKDKMEVMKNKSKLKPGKVFIDNDLTRKEREQQRVMRLRAQEERGKGKEVKTGYNKITIEGIEWRWNKSKERLEKQESKN